jgi:BAI1-associated protein 3
MLGIVPEVHKSPLSRQTSAAGASSDEEGASESKLGFMKRLKSFRKSTIRRSQGREKNVSTAGSTLQNYPSLRDKLPVKYIQTTDVKKATLNPVWMEKFRFNIEGSKTETFHLDIWDHDDEFSVFEAARKLNQVQGFKGLNRYFKQIAQSARTNSNEGFVDDFLGSVNLKISEIPSTGIDKWFSLEGRSENSKVHGQIHIRANLATREDRGISEEDNWTDIKQHVELLQIFIDHELNKFKGETTGWSGELSREAETILHQHAIQGDITDIQRKMCRWISYSKKHLERTLTHKLLLLITEQLEQSWQPTSLSRDESDMLREAFTLFINHSFKQLAKIRELFPAANRMAMERLEQLLT